VSRGELALQVLRGADADSLPVVRKGTNRPMFDHGSWSASASRRKGFRRTASSSTSFHLYTRYATCSGICCRCSRAGGAARTFLAVHCGQQRLKRRIRQSEERLSLALAATNSGIWNTTPDQEAYYDPAGSPCWATSRRSSPAYESWADLLHPDIGRGPSRPCMVLCRKEGLQPGVPHAQPRRPMALDLFDARSWSAMHRQRPAHRRHPRGHRRAQRTQEELEQANQNLERRVKERTRELATLNALAAVVSRSLDLKEIMESGLQQTLAPRRGTGRPTAGRADPALVLMAHRDCRNGSFPAPPASSENGPGRKADRHGAPIVWSLADYPEES